MPALANNEHQRIVMRLAEAFSAVIDWDKGDQSLPGCNVSDRDKDWKQNYRCPDVALYKPRGLPAETLRFRLHPGEEDSVRDAQ